MKTLVDLLVTSETKKELLKLLWQEGVEASAHQLALLANRSYAAVYTELEQLVSDGLVSKSRVGRANLYSRNSQSEFANQLVLVVGEAKPHVELGELDDQEVEAHLFRYGAPLGEAKLGQKRLSIEETLVAGVMLARRNSTVARVLPVVLAKNSRDTNFSKLLFLAQKEGVTQGIGFLLDLTGTLSGSRKFKELACTLKDRRVKNQQSFFVGSPKGKFAKLLEERNTPKLAKKWHFSMNMGLDSFSSLFEKAMVVEE